MDARNTPLQLLLVGLFSIVLVFILKYLFGASWSVAFARISFFLLFLILIIGPLMKLHPSHKISTPLATPWNWRSELGIWFFLTALIHFIFVLFERPFSSLIKIGGSGFALTNLIGLIALIWALILTATSFSKIIGYFGIESWRWLHSFTYVIFYLVSVHFIYFQFFSTFGKVGPDWFGYTAVIMALIVVVLQLIAFVATIIKNRSNIQV